MRGPSHATMVAAMTETLQDPLPPTPVRRLVRDSDDKVVGGVCAAVGRYTDTDPVLWRVVVGALAVAGGAGFALYALAWLLIPRADQPASFAERQLRRPDRSVNVAGVVLLVVVTLVLLALLDDGSGAVVVVVVAGLAFLVARERRVAGPAAPGDVPYAAAGAPSSYGVPPVAPYAPVAPAPPRERSVLGPVTLSVAALVAGVLLVLREAGQDWVTAPRVIAAAMLVVGAGLVVGTWVGRARWLLAVGLVLGLLLVPASAADGGAGDRTWVPTAADGTTTFRLGAGEAVLDLRQLEPGSVDEIAARVGLGSLTVLVPDDLRVRATTDVGLGEVRQDGERDRTDTIVLGPVAGDELRLDLEVGVGEIEVRRVAA